MSIFYKQNIEFNCILCYFDIIKSMEEIILSNSEEITTILTNLAKQGKKRNLEKRNLIIGDNIKKHRKSVKNIIWSEYGQAEFPSDNNFAIF